MPTLSITIEAPEIVLSLITKGLDESQYTLIQPDAIWPGYNVKVIGYETNEETQ